MRPAAPARLRRWRAGPAERRTHLLMLSLSLGSVVGADGLRVLSHLPGPGPASSKARGNRALRRAGQGCPICRASVWPPGHARTQPGQDTGPTLSGRPREQPRDSPDAGQGPVRPPNVQEVKAYGARPGPLREQTRTANGPGVLRPVQGVG
jgi:hypothetical protein